MRKYSAGSDGVHPTLTFLQNRSADARNIYDHVTVQLTCRCHTRLTLHDMVDMDWWHLKMRRLLPAPNVKLDLNLS